MTHNDLLLLLLGSFLPNNILIWLYKGLFRRHKHLRIEPHKPKLISPRRYYAKFESEPKTQYRYHRKMTHFWMGNALPMNGLVALDIWAILNNRTELALLMGAILLAINTNYSLYANWDTEVGDAHAAYAGIRADEIQAATAPDSFATVQTSTAVVYTQAEANASTLQTETTT